MKVTLTSLVDLGYYVSILSPLRNQIIATLHGGSSPVMLSRNRLKVVFSAAPSSTNFTCRNDKDFLDKSFYTLRMLQEVEIESLKDSHHLRMEKSTWS